MANILTPKRIADMISQASLAIRYAYSPYSKYRVGACIMSSDGALYTGCNVENASYSLTTCAETAAISAMIATGRRMIIAAVVIGSGETLCTPCGACRQRFREFAKNDVPIYLVQEGSREVGKMMTVGELLPNSFGPAHLAI